MDATKLQPLETSNGRYRTSQQPGLQNANQGTSSVGSRSNRHGMQPVLGLLSVAGGLVTTLETSMFADATTTMTVHREKGRHS